LPEESKKKLMNEAFIPKFSVIFNIYNERKALDIKNIVYYPTILTPNHKPNHLENLKKYYR
jgi:hypothetical protein